MVALITEIIPPQGFEIVRDRIIEILLTELTNQRVLQPTLPEFSLFLDRKTRIDKSESVLVNVGLDNANYENYGERGAQGVTVYNIDVYANGAGSSTVHGDLDAAKKMHRYLGLIRYIFSSTKYNTLGFDQGAIGNKSIRNMQIYDASGNQDAKFIKMGRLALGVKIEENQALWNGVALQGTTTELKLELTEKGYKYELNN